MHGKPTSAATASASSIVWAIPERAVSRPIFFHCDIETATVFGFINRIGGGANHGHAEFSQDPLTLQLERAVQRRLAAHGRQHRIRALFFR